MSILVNVGAGAKAVAPQISAETLEKPGAFEAAYKQWRHYELKRSLATKIEQTARCGHFAFLSGDRPELTGRSRATTQSQRARTARMDASV